MINPPIPFLAGAYGRASDARSIIPVGEWSILTPIYNMGASLEEFPSLSKAEVQRLVEKDVDGAVGNLEATLDGKSILKHVSRLKWNETGWSPVRYPESKRSCAGRRFYRDDFRWVLVVLESSCAR